MFSIRYNEISVGCQILFTCQVKSRGMEHHDPQYIFKKWKSKKLLKKNNVEWRHASRTCYTQDRNDSPSQQLIFEFLSIVRFSFFCCVGIRWYLLVFCFLSSSLPTGFLKHLRFLAVVVLFPLKYFSARHSPRTVIVRVFCQIEFDQTFCVGFEQQKKEQTRTEIK